MRETYSAHVLDHYARPRNLGRLPEADGRGVAGDLREGDTQIEIAIQVREARVTAVRHRTFGCSATIAAASVATELIAGRPVTAAGALTAAEITAALGGLPPDRLYAPDLAVTAVHRAVADFHRRGAGES